MEFFILSDPAIYEIWKFDDGNTDLVLCPNEWRIVATNRRGKVSIENARTGALRSISEWKVLLKNA
jgi:hypothetical protein